MHLDGADVTYQGSARKGGPQPGDVGRVLVGDETSAHVQWTTGSRTGQVDLVDQSDLADDEVDPSAAMLATAVANSLDLMGDEDVEAVLDRMVESGDLTALESLADQTLQWVASQVRTVAAVRTASVGMTADNAQGLIQAATAQVLRTALESLED